MKMLAETMMRKKLKARPSVSLYGIPYSKTRIRVIAVITSSITFSHPAFVRRNPKYMQGQQVKHTQSMPPCSPPPPAYAAGWITVGRPAPADHPTDIFSRTDGTDFKVQDSK